MSLALALVAFLDLAPVFASDSAAPSAEPAEEAKPDHSRALVGFDLGAGVGAGGGRSGMVYALKLRFGWQFNRLLGTSLQGSLLTWDTARATSADGTYTASGQLGFQLTPLVALTPGNVFEIAAGPSFDGLGTGSQTMAARFSKRTADGDPIAYGGFYPGAHARFAVHLLTDRTPESGRRTSLTLGADTHTTFVEGGALAVFTAGFGVDMY